MENGLEQVKQGSANVKTAVEYKKSAMRKKVSGSVWFNRILSSEFVIMQTAHNLNNFKILINKELDE